MDETLPTSLDTDVHTIGQTDKLQPALKKMKCVSQAQLGDEALTITPKSGQLCPLDMLQQAKLSTQISVNSISNASGNNSGVKQGQLQEETITKTLFTSKGNNPKRSILRLSNGKLVAKSLINTHECSTLYSQQSIAEATVCPDEEITQP